MSIIAFPAGLPAPNSMSFGLAANTQSGGRSPFDGTEQTLALPGDRWAAELRWHDLDEPDWRVLQGFLAFLRGRAGRFTWSPAKFPRRGTATSAGGLGPRVRATSTGTILQMTGFAPFTGPTFRQGDLVGYLNPSGRPMLHMVGADSGTDADGNSNIFVAPAIRRSPNVDEPLILTNPAAVWMLTQDRVVPDYEPGPRGFSVTLPIEEAIF